MKSLQQYRETVFKIIGAAMEVHANLKFGLLEAVYQEALVLELQARGINCEVEANVDVYYKNILLKKKYRMDIVVDDIVVELKSSSKIVSAHRAQICNYLRLTKKPIGVILNFGSDQLQGERWAYDESINSCFLIDRNMTPLVMDEKLFNDGTEYSEE